MKSSKCGSEMSSTSKFGNIEKKVKGVYSGNRSYSIYQTSENVLKRSMSEGTFKELNSKSKSPRIKKYSSNHKLILKNKKNRFRRRNMFKSKIENIRKIYQKHEMKLKMLIMRQHRFYEKFIKGISKKLRSVDNLFAKLRNKIDDLQYKNKNYFQLEDVKSLGFLLNNKHYNNTRFQGSKLYYKINKIMNENKILKKKFKKVSKEVVLNKSERIIVDSGLGSFDWSSLLYKSYDEKGDSVNIS
jgi:hypothetical protein